MGHTGASTWRHTGGLVYLVGLGGCEEDLGPHSRVGATADMGVDAHYFEAVLGHDGLDLHPIRVRVRYGFTLFRL